MVLGLLVKPDFTRPNGLVCLHEEESISKIKRIVKAFGPRIVVEFGTKHGGFTSVLAECTASPTRIYSFDAANSDILPDRTLFPKRVEFICQNLLGSASEEVTTILKRKSKKLLYCDNGNKIRELELYANFLREGDLLGVHDWGIELKQDDVSEILKDFDEHEWSEFEEEDLTTRFWIKKSTEA